MSIPGLGQIPEDAPVITNRTISLSPYWEWRFEAGFSTPVTVRITSGTAEKDGTELALNQTYTFSGLHSKILTWTGCDLEIDGPTLSDSIQEYHTITSQPANAFMNLHHKLTALRTKARREGGTGPRVMLVGPAATGKSVAARTLTAYATRCEEQPLVVNLAPNEGMLSVPGTLSASVFASVMDIESPDGWGSSPSSGPSVVPVKLPVVFYYGHSMPEKDLPMYRNMVSGMAGLATERLSEDKDVKIAGFIIDTPSVTAGDREGVDTLAHIAEEYSVNIIIVLDDSPALSTELQRRFTGATTSLGDSVATILLDKSTGAQPRSESWISQSHQASIKHYFFGDNNQTLSPFTQQVDVNSLTLYQIPEDTSSSALLPIDLTGALEQWTLTIMNASPRDPVETIRSAAVLGFVYVAQVDGDKNKAKILTPMAGRLGDHPMVWGRWPEPNINLLG